MTVTTPQDAATKPGKRPANIKLPLSEEPSVQLLPPSVRDRAATRSRIRTGVLLVILGIIIAVAIFAAASFRVVQAQQALADANNRTVELLAEQAKYTEATRINALIAQIEELQKGATVSEINWSQLLNELLVRLPEGAEISTVNFAGIKPWEQIAAGEGTQSEIIATIEFTLLTTTIPEATAYSRSLATLDGYAVSTLSPIAVGTDGRVTSTIALALTWDAESKRFVEGADGGDEGDKAGGSTTESDDSVIDSTDETAED